MPSPPTSQKDRPISLVGTHGSCTFTIRPEDLQWTEPSRIAAIQTLGGAWVDAFGPGVATIAIAGHTGWRGPEGGADWQAQFMELYEVAFKGWHDLVESTKDPEAPNMQFVDTLDNRCVIVAPQTFVLKRSKNRPLLMQYHITFLVMRDAGTPPPPPSPEKSPLEQFIDAMESLRNILGQIQGWLNTILDAIRGDPGAIVALINEIFGPEVGAAVDAILGVVNNGLGIINSVADADLSPSVPSRSFLGDPGHNLTPAIGQEGNSGTASAESAQALLDAVGAICAAGSTAVSNLLVSPEAKPMNSVERAKLMEVASTFHNAECLLANAFQQPALSYPDHDALYGASTCSSTSWGRPLSPWRDENPFELLLPVETPYVTQSVEAIHAVQSLRRSDPVLHPLPPATVAAYLHAVAGGTRFREGF